MFKKFCYCSVPWAKALYLKANVRHVDLDPEYDKERKATILQRKEKQHVPSSQPFTLHLLVTINESSNIELISRGPSVFHRHANKSMNGFLQDFRVINNPDYQQLSQTSHQEDLPKEALRSLEWLLLRLIQTEAVEVREDASLYPDFSKPAVGKWVVTLAKS